MLDLLLFLLALAGTAVVFADVLVGDGMLLAPVQRWLRERWRGRIKYQWAKARIAFLTEQLPEIIEMEAYGKRTQEIDRLRERYITELDNQWWWPPLWGCFKCVAGQWGFWGFLIYLGRHLPAGPDLWLLRYWHAYSLPEHIAFTAFTIIAAIILHKWTSES